MLVCTACPLLVKCGIVGGGWVSLFMPSAALKAYGKHCHAHVASACCHCPHANSMTGQRNHSQKDTTVNVKPGDVGNVEEWVNRFAWSTVNTAEAGVQAQVERSRVMTGV